MQTPFPFFILTPLGFSLLKFLCPQCELNTLVPVIANRDPAQRFWRAAELTLWETGLSLVSWICICCFQRLQWTFSHTQFNGLNTRLLRWPKGFQSCLTGLMSTTQEIPAIWRCRPGRILEGIQGSSIYLCLGNQVQLFFDYRWFSEIKIRLSARPLGLSLPFMWKTWFFMEFQRTIQACP